eukprot:gene24659-31028_t
MIGIKSSEPDVAEPAKKLSTRQRKALSKNNNLVVVDLTAESIAAIQATLPVQKKQKVAGGVTSNENAFQKPSKIPTTSTVYASSSFSSFGISGQRKRLNKRKRDEEVLELQIDSVVHEALVNDTASNTQHVQPSVAISQSSALRVDDSSVNAKQFSRTSEKVVYDVDNECYVHSDLKKISDLMNLHNEKQSAPLKPANAQAVCGTVEEHAVSSSTTNSFFTSTPDPTPSLESILKAKLKLRLQLAAMKQQAVKTASSEGAVATKPPASSETSANTTNSVLIDENDTINTSTTTDKKITYAKATLRTIRSQVEPSDLPLSQRPYANCVTTTMSAAQWRDSQQKQSGAKKPTPPVVPPSPPSSSQSITPSDITMSVDSTLLFVLDYAGDKQLAPMPAQPAAVVDKAPPSLPLVTPPAKRPFEEVFHATQLTTSGKAHAQVVEVSTPSHRHHLTSTSVPQRRSSAGFEEVNPASRPEDTSPTASTKLTRSSSQVTPAMTPSQIRQAGFEEVSQITTPTGGSATKKRKVALPDSNAVQSIYTVSEMSAPTDTETDTTSDTSITDILTQYNATLHTPSAAKGYSEFTEYLLASYVPYSAAHRPRTLTDSVFYSQPPPLPVQPPAPSMSIETETAIQINMRLMSEGRGGAESVLNSSNPSQYNTSNHSDVLFGCEVDNLAELFVSILRGGGGGVNVKSVDRDELHSKISTVFRGLYRVKQHMVSLLGDIREVLSVDSKLDSVKGVGMLYECCKVLND